LTNKKNKLRMLRSKFKKNSINVRNKSCKKRRKSSSWSRCLRT